MGRVRNRGVDDLDIKRGIQESFSGYSLSAQTPRELNSYLGDAKCSSEFQEEVTMSSIPKGTLKRDQGLLSGIYSCLFSVIDLSPLILTTVSVQDLDSSIVLYSIREGNWTSLIGLKDAYFQILPRVIQEVPIVSLLGTVKKV